MKKVHTWIVGIDEVGRGPIAGPVAVCACAMSTEAYKRVRWTGLTDSKQLSERARERWYQVAQDLQERGVLQYKVSFVSAREIDRRGIVPAIRTALSKSITTVAKHPDETLVLLDGGLRPPEQFVHQQTIVRGDQKKKSIALASVIAKVTRDRLMVKLHTKYPEYSWNRNKGYGTKAHYRAISTYGTTPEHRKTFLEKK